MIMRALSIKEPWASMILNGEKTIEIRTWKTKFRGKLILCASKSPKSEISGHAFAIVELVDIHPMTKDDCGPSKCEYLEGQYAWVLKNIQSFKKFPIKGRLGFFDIDTKKKNVVVK